MSCKSNKGKHDWRDDEGGVWCEYCTMPENSFNAYKVAIDLIKSKK